MSHGLHSGAVKRRLATQTVTMLKSSCWQLLSEVELRRIFDVCKRWVNSDFACLCKLIWFDIWGHTGDSLTARMKMQHLRSASGWTAGYAAFPLAVRPPPVLASCIKIYYFHSPRRSLVYLDFCFRHFSLSLKIFFIENTCIKKIWLNGTKSSPFKQICRLRVTKRILWYDN